MNADEWDEPIDFTDAVPREVLAIQEVWGLVDHMALTLRQGGREITPRQLAGVLIEFGLDKVREMLDMGDEDE